MSRGTNYNVTGAAATGTDKTILGLTSTAAIRPEVDYISIGFSGAPADAAAIMHVKRFTAAGTAGSAVTPPAIDSASPAAVAVVGKGVYSVEPTYATEPLFDWALNQRHTLQWWAMPGKEVILPATAANGIGVKSSSVSTGTPTAEVGLSWLE